MATTRYSAIKLKHASAEKTEDALALEHPLSISINGEPFSLTMQSPGNERELVRGLLFTEGVVKKKSGELDFQVIETSDQNFVSKVNILIPAVELDHNRLNKRNLLSVASCGICGTTELHVPDMEAIVSSDVIRLNDVLEMFRTMSSVQKSFIESGGSHASAAFDSNKEMITMMEDIGRHNAVDKVIGHLLNHGNLKQAKCLLVSGRVSYEIVTKCFMAGIPFLMAVSAPSSLAVDFAKELGITLLGFCREDRATVYSHPERLV